ncbi:zinc finger protein ZFPM1-like isoform X2 [Nannospalax galili]|uniref:zinc finger protein ZFPM1-like isoform X2 n=1 Tax=Nannospalax galili TaxID=1026970 RepID=UPI00111C6445|nr:zinc finger protein ZFPM1-like isoform X2 [Nannospalax galili]
MQISVPRRSLMAPPAAVAAASGSGGVFGRRRQGDLSLQFALGSLGAPSPGCAGAPSPFRSGGGGGAQQVQLRVPATRIAPPLPSCRRPRRRPPGPPPPRRRLRARSSSGGCQPDSRRRSFLSPAPVALSPPPPRIHFPPALCKVPRASMCQETRLWLRRSLR